MRVTGPRALCVWFLAAACGKQATGATGAAGSEPSSWRPPAASVASALEAPATPPVGSPDSGPLLVRTEPVSFAPVAHSADASVVTITSVIDKLEFSPFTRLARRRRSQGLGTGFVFDKNGIVLTNNHVVEGAAEIYVKLSDEREFPGKVIGTDPATDISAVRIDSKGLHALPLGNSDALDVGDWVVAIGNPFGLSHTVSAGIISGKGRTRQDVELDSTGYYDFLQTDASINPGNSGGPLLNLRGEVVGINTLIRAGGAQGIGFAIPINMVKQLLPMLLRDGHITRSALGVRIIDARELSPEDRTALKLPESSRVTGAVVEFVVPGGPADRAGLAPGDIIVGFEGQPIDRATQLQWLASTGGVGRTVVLRVQRANQQVEIKLTLGRLADDGPAGSPR